MVGGVWVSKKAEIRYETVKDFINGKISRKHAASSLGITERAVTNLANQACQLNSCTQKQSTGLALHAKNKTRQCKPAHSWATGATTEDRVV